MRIGKIMLVTGLTQLATAALAVDAERRVDPRWLTAFGFALFVIGFLLSARQTAQTDFYEMLIPQMVRGAEIMVCLLPPTRMALGRLPASMVADGSELFNLMRNLGGAVGLALIDTTIFSRATTQASAIAGKLRAGDVATAVQIGIPKDAFLEQRGQPLDEFATEMVRLLVEKASLLPAVNAAWLLCGVLTAITLFTLLVVSRTPPGSSSHMNQASSPSTASGQIITLGSRS